MAIYNSTGASYDRVINWEEALDFLGELFRTSNKDNQSKSQLSSLLFRKVVNNNSIFIERWWNYIYLYDASLRLNIPNKYRILRPFISIKIILLLLSILMTMMSLGFPNTPKSINSLFDTLYNNPISFSFFLIGAFLFSFVYINTTIPGILKVYLKSSSNFLIADKLSLWLLLIKSIGISSSDLKNSFGGNISKALPKLYLHYNLKERIKFKEKLKNERVWK